MYDKVRYDNDDGNDYDDNDDEDDDNDNGDDGRCCYIASCIVEYIFYF